MGHFLVLCVCQLSYSSNHTSIFGGYFVCHLFTCPTMAEDDVTQVVAVNGSGVCKERFAGGDAPREKEVSIQICKLYIVDVDVDLQTIEA